MAELVYNNAKNVNTNHIPFELNYGYHPCISYKRDIDPCFRLKLAEELLNEL